MTGLTFRQGTPHDFPALAKIISSTEAWRCFGIDYVIALELFNHMDDTVYIAEREELLVGFITLKPNGVGNIGAYTRMIAVAEQWRNKGIGRQMVEYVCNAAFPRIANLFLICSVENIAAQNFYEKIGFEKVGVLRDLVVAGHDEIFYRKTFGTLR